MVFTLIINFAYPWVFNDVHNFLETIAVMAAKFFCSTFYNVSVATSLQRDKTRIAAYQADIRNIYQCAQSEAPCSRRRISCAARTRAR